MRGIVVEITMKEAMAIITENTMNITMIVMIVEGTAKCGVLYPHGLPGLLGGIAGCRHSGRPDIDP
jgi:hypothetical protein